MAGLQKVVGELPYVLKRTSAKKAAGPDKVQSKLYKDPKAVMPILCELGEFTERNYNPFARDAMQRSRMVMLDKGKNRFRPIQILNVQRKVTEKVIDNCLRVVGSYIGL